MTNEELKKKIVDIIAPWVSAYGDDEAIADALIAAGIGDVKEAQRRVEVGERALLIACGNITKELWQDKFAWRTRNYYDNMIQQAEKELAEEKKDEN